MSPMGKRPPDGGVEIHQSWSGRLSEAAMHARTVRLRLCDAMTPVVDGLRSRLD